MASQREIRIASAADRRHIARLRHEVYAAELAQHTTNDAGELADRLDEGNTYIVVARPGAPPHAFVSITPPWLGALSIDKYIDRRQWPGLQGDDLFEVRILTVARASRGSTDAALLMYAALRWIDSRGGRRIVAMGRSDLMDMYRAAGLHPLGSTITSGALAFELMSAEVDALSALARHRAPLVARLLGDVAWRLDMPAVEPASECMHGGASYSAIGERFEHLDRREDVVVADVLDAWFDPPEAVLAPLRGNLEWATRSSPPTDSAGLIAAIAEHRDLPPNTLVVGGGSSDLIYQALGHWLDSSSTVVLVEPSYGEYAHVCRHVIGCRVERLVARAADGWRIDLGELRAAVARDDVDLVVIVNPNNPTGTHIPPAVLGEVLAGVAGGTRVWIDEAYVEYAGVDASLERVAATTPGVVVCKSLSKMYALSGLRAAYLVCAADEAAALRRLSPPWAVSLPAQMAAVAALANGPAYAALWAQTATLREQLTRGLAAAMADLASNGDWSVTPGVGNYVLLRLPETADPAPIVTARCRRAGVFVRDLTGMSAQFAERTIRIAVRPPSEIDRIVAAVRDAA